MSEPGDETLLQAIGKQDRKAYEALIERYLEGVMRFILKMSGDRMMAEDIAQETFIRLWHKADRYQPTGSGRGWLFQMAYRLMQDAYRKQKPMQDIDGLQMATAEHTEKCLQRVEEQQLLSDQLTQLPERQRMALILFHYEELSQAEIAVAMGETESAVESLLYRGRKLLKAKVQQKLEAIGEAE